MVRKSGAGRKPKKGKSSTYRKRASFADEQVTSEEALQFIRDLQKQFQNKPLKTDEDKAKVQNYLADNFTDKQLKAYGRRIQGDLMLRPPQTNPPPAFAKTRRSRKKPK